MRWIALGLGLLVLAGCTTSPVNEKSAKPAPADRVLLFQTPRDGGATIVVTRDSGWLAGGCYVAVLIDGQKAARIGPGEVARFNVEAGRHMIGMAGDADGAGMCGLQIGQWVKESATELRPGEIQRFRVSADSSAGMDIRPTSF